MPVTVVVGGQFGGEGKGKVAHFLAQETGSRIAIRVGGTNSGHTVIDPSGQPIILRQLPTPAILSNVTCVLPAGSYINTDILFEEIARTGLSHDRLYIDPNAMIITAQEQQEEKNSLLGGSIGSTLSGTGAAVTKRISRHTTVKLAKDDDRLSGFIKPVTELLRDSVVDGERILIEGTQGYGLSLLHSQYYPFVTSRDTTAAAFVAEAGLSPLDVDDIVLVIRSFPIRVGGNSGHLPYEITWGTVTEEAESQLPILEYTSVTRKERRVARFDNEVVKRAIVINNPTRIVCNHLDYINANILSDKLHRFIENIESQIGRSIDYFGFGPALIRNRHTVLKEVKIS